MERRILKMYIFRLPTPAQFIVSRTASSVALKRSPTYNTPGPLMEPLCTTNVWISQQCQHMRNWESSRNKVEIAGEIDTVDGYYCQLQVINYKYISTGSILVSSKYDIIFCLNIFTTSFSFYYLNRINITQKFFDKYLDLQHKRTTTYSL